MELRFISYFHTTTVCDKSLAKIVDMPILTLKVTGSVVVALILNIIITYLDNSSINHHDIWITKSRNYNARKNELFLTLEQ